MGTYKEIRGTHIVSVTSDPPSPVNGQMWYNSTDKVVKGFTSNPAGTWATISAINTARGSGSLAGTATSAWFAGGEINPPHPSPGSNWSTKNELWNGTSWTESNDLTRPGFYSGMQSRGVPNNTTGLVFGGHQGTNPASQYAQTEEWNGSSWTEVGDLNTGRRGGGGAGTSAEACLCFGAGYGNPFVGQDLNESWNGSSWTEVADLNTASTGRASFGSSTSALYARSNPAIRVETWNGSSWTETADYSNTGKDGGSGVVNTSGLIFGGHPTGYTEVWNGSSWTETGDFNVARPGASGAGAGAGSAIAAGGYNPSPGVYVTNAEEFISPTTSTVTFTVS